MRYKLVENDKKLQADMGHYYAISIDGNRFIVDKNWVLENINFISNVKATRAGALYVVQDKFEKATNHLVNLIKNDLYRGEGGLNLTQDLRIFGFQSTNITCSTKITSKSTKLDCYSVIRSYNLDGRAIYMKLFTSVMKEFFINQFTVYIWTNHKEVRLFFTEKAAARQKCKTQSGDVRRFVNMNDMMNYIREKC